MKNFSLSDENFKEKTSSAASSQVAGILKSFYGLSVSLLVIIKNIGLSEEYFILLLSLCGLFTVSCAFLTSEFDKESSLDNFNYEKLNSRESLDEQDVHVDHNNQAEDNVLGKLKVAFYFQLILLFSLFMVNISDIFLTISPTGYLFISLCLLFLLLFGSTSIKNLQVSSQQSSEKKEISVVDHKQKESNWLNTLRSFNFFLLFLSMSIGMGCGLSIISNAQLIINSKLIKNYEMYSNFENFTLGLLPRTNPYYSEFENLSDFAAIFLSLLSIANCLGRVIIGFIVDKLTHRLSQEYSKVVITTLVFLGFLSSMLLGALIFIIAGDNVIILFFAAFLSGLSYGAYWTLAPSLAFDLFGKKYFGQNYGLLCFAPTVGSLFLDSLLATDLYKSELKYERRSFSPSVTSCFGDICFKEFFQVESLTLVLAMISTFWLFRRLVSAQENNNE
eukprot:snap_masked-scaffold_15-processed-gene-8.29-mRNA-1 protein AED:1.00 eAED:1.00 QI:0/-1/0/0/-1/1/1/0/446